MNGKVFVLIARKGAGKSNFIEKRILKPWGFRANYIYNINHEYNDYVNAFTEENTKENFLRVVQREASHPGAYCNIIFEEADTYLRKSGEQDGRIMNQIVRTYHTKNIVVFVFHSILSIPKEIRSNIDFWVIFQTQDDDEEVKKFYKGRRDVLDRYFDVRKKTEGTYFDRDKKIYADERSKKFWHYYRVIAA